MLDSSVFESIFLQTEVGPMLICMYFTTRICLLADLKNQPIVSSCVTHILPLCGYFKGQEQICFNPTSWHLVT